MGGKVFTWGSVGSGLAWIHRLLGVSWKKGFARLTRGEFYVPTFCCLGKGIKEMTGCSDVVLSRQTHSFMLRGWRAGSRERKVVEVSFSRRKERGPVVVIIYLLYMSSRRMTGRHIRMSMGGRYCYLHRLHDWRI
jgi:hypothetical protein